LIVSILSPHIDDAAFGLTQTIFNLAKKGIRVNIINCFTISKWTAIPIVNKEISAVSKLRKDEDIAFYKLISEKIVIKNLDLLDAPLRNGYIFQNQPFQQNELELVEELRKLLELLAHGIIFCPLAIGNHIDHAVCREAVNRLYTKRQVVFFEDMPYAQRIGEDQIRRHVNGLQQELGVHLTTFTVSSSNNFVDKGNAIRTYGSQINEEIVTEILSHFEALGGERLWGEEGLLREIKEALNQTKV
jgi:LmbE family N-acetylglucosaminyl deacetylase